MVPKGGLTSLVLDYLKMRVGNDVKQRLFSVFFPSCVPESKGIERLGQYILPEETLP